MIEFTTAAPTRFGVANRCLERGFGRCKKGIDSYLLDIYLSER
jgi:hypothetical protein